MYCGVCVPFRAMKSEAVFHRIRQAAGTLGVSDATLRQAIARELSRSYARCVKALLPQFGTSVYLRMAKDIYNNDPNRDESLIRNHLRGTNKPGENWPKYREWFVTVSKSDGGIDQARLLEQLAAIERRLATWSLWAAQGRRRTGEEYPDDPGDPEIVEEALNSLLKKASEIPSASSAQLEIPLDLRPPVARTLVPRAAYSKQLAETGFFGLVLQGPPGAGKRYIVLDFLRNRGSPVLWCHLGDSSTFAEILSRVAGVLGCGADESAVLPALVARDALLVLDGITQANMSAFAACMQKACTMQGPLRLLALSQIRMDRCNVIDMDFLTPDEIAAIASASPVTIDADAVQHLKRERGLYPWTLVRALTGLGSTVNIPAQLGHSRAEEIRAHLSLQERQVLALVSELGAEFDLRSVQIALRELGCGMPAPDFLANLESRFAVTPTTMATWRPEVTVEPSIDVVPGPVRARVLEFLGLEYEAVAWEGPPPRKTRPYAACRAAFKACRAFQLSDGNLKRRSALLSKFAASIRAHGMLAELRQLCEHEVANNPERSRWIDVRLVNCMHIQGDLHGEHRILSQLFDDPATHDDPNQILSILRALAEWLIDAGHPDFAIAILDAAIRRESISRLDAVSAAQAVSMLSWALLFCGRIQESLDLNEKVLGEELGALEPGLGVAVRHARTGIAWRRASKFAEALKALTIANRLFDGRDRRGFAWTALNLAETLRQTGDSEAACKWYRSGVLVASAHGMVDCESYAIAQRFVQDAACSLVHIEASQEMERLREYENRRREIATGIAGDPFVRRVMLFLGAELSSKAIDLTQYSLMRSSSQHKIGSAFTRTLVRGAVREDPERQLAQIFGQNEPKNIFPQPFLNNIVTKACAGAPYLIGIYLRPHLAVISRQTDSVLMHYARFFERIGDVGIAEELLSHVREQASFEFFNIKANCAGRQRHRRDEAMALNEKALRCAPDDSARVRILTNMARLIYSNGILGQYRRAIELCEQAIETSGRRRFQWAENLLLQLLLEALPRKKTERIIKEHADRFGVTFSYLIREVAPEIKDRACRRRALAALARLRSRVSRK